MCTNVKYSQYLIKEKQFFLIKNLNVLKILNQYPIDFE